MKVEPVANLYFHLFFFFFWGGGGGGRAIEITHASLGSFPSERQLTQKIQKDEVMNGQHKQKKKKMINKI